LACILRRGLGPIAAAGQDEASEDDDGNSDDGDE
jgi:hypothetical protein